MGCVASTSQLKKQMKQQEKQIEILERATKLYSLQCAEFEHKDPYNIEEEYVIGRKKVHAIANKQFKHIGSFQDQVSKRFDDLEDITRGIYQKIGKEVPADLRQSKQNDLLNNGVILEKLEHPDKLVKDVCVTKQYGVIAGKKIKGKPIKVPEDGFQDNDLLSSPERKPVQKIIKEVREEEMASSPERKNPKKFMQLRSANRRATSKI